MKKLLLLLSLIIMTFEAQAVDINVTVNSCGGLAGNTSDRGGDSICGDFNQKLVDYVNEDQPDVSIDKYADGVANATGFSMRGQSSDYAENFSLFTFKPSFGLAAQGDVNEPESAEGVGLGGALTVGINLDLLPIDKIGPVEFKKMDLFVSFFSYNLDQEIGEDTEGSGDLSSFSVMARYRILDGMDIVPGYMLEWGGLHIHTGFQRNKMGIDMTQSFEDETVSDDDSGAEGKFQDGEANFELDSESTTIPFEVSTYMRFLYAFTLYGGAGFDYIVSSSTDVDLNASGNFVGTGGGAGGYDADIDANESASGEGEATNFRAFAGFQVNIPFVRVYVQANKGLGNDLVGANFGVKIAY